MDRDQDRPSVEIEPAPSQYTFITRHQMPISMYSIPDYTLDQLCKGYSSPALGLFGAAVSLFAAAVVVLLTVPLTPHMYGGFFGTAVATGGLTLLFGGLAARDWWSARALVKQIKGGSIPLPPSPRPF